MRHSSRHLVHLSLVSVAFALASVGCGDDSLNDDLFADANGTEIAASAGARGPSGSNAPGEPSGGATGAGADVTASGSSEVAIGGSASASQGTAPAGSSPPAGGEPSGGGGGTASGGGASSSGASTVLTAELHLCGKLQSYTASSLTIAGKALPIAAGTTVTGSVLASIGADVCLDAKIDAAGSVRGSASLSLDLDLDLDASARARACGKVTVYAAASTSSKGMVAVGGAGFDIAAGAAISGEAKLVVAASVCVDARLGSDGAIAKATVTAN